MTTADPIGTWPDTGSEHRQLVGLLGDLRTQHARHARCEQREDLQELTRQGLLHDVVVDGEWAGIIAGEPDNRRGVSGATVVELLLSPEHRGHGLGKHLSTLLAKALPMDDGECLMGTIHADNVRAYRAALSAGRVDVGGEVRIACRG